MKFQMSHAIRVRLLLPAFTALVLLGYVTPVLSQETRTLTARWLLDVERGEVIENGIVIVKGDRIAARGRKGEIAPEGEQINLGDATLMPGMIDAHVHLTLAGAGEANARATLRAGFTTVQDLGAVNYENIKIRNSIRDGKFPGPHVVASGPWLGVAKGTCDFQGIGVKGADAFRARIKKDVDEGADLIKVCASGWLAEAAERPDACEISEEELRAAIDQAHVLKRRVAVHAISERAIAAAVTHGADLIVHGGFTSKETVAAMAQRPVFQIPTLFSLKGSVPPAVYEQLQSIWPPQSTMDSQSLSALTRRHPPRPECKRVHRARCSWTKPLDAIRAATVEAAKAVGRRARPEC